MPTRRCRRTSESGRGRAKNNKRHACAKRCESRDERELQDGFAGRDKRYNAAASDTMNGRAREIKDRSLNHPSTLQHNLGRHLAMRRRHRIGGLFDCNLGQVEARGGGVDNRPQKLRTVGHAARLQAAHKVAVRPARAVLGPLLRHLQQSHPRRLVVPKERGVVQPALSEIDCALPPNLRSPMQ